MDRRKIALWRHEQIEELTDPTLGKLTRCELLRKTARLAVRWPSGDERPISEPTLRRWLRAYAERGLEGLMPRVRAPARPRPVLERAALEHAIALLREEPERSLTMLGALLRIEKGVDVSRSTLHRHLERHPAYRRLRKLAKSGGTQARRRFQARSPHEIWQSDSKGPFLVKLRSGKVLAVHVFTILDDFSRATLASCAVEAPDLEAAVRVFTIAARRWGLPAKLYLDRAGIYDSDTFRGGLATLGIRRIAGRPRNPPARGKIEAFHRVLERWFIRELRHQVVEDLEHINQLLNALLEEIYMNHRHRTMKMTPRAALAGAMSSRQVAPDRLRDAFLQRKEKRSHPKTGEVELGALLFKVPADLRGRRLTFAYHPLERDVAFVELPGEKPKRLALAVNLTEPAAPLERYGAGRLQAIYEHWRGRSLPQAQAGFGLPEIFELFARKLARTVPRDELEAHRLQAFWRSCGPLAREAFEDAFRKVFLRLGTGRPLESYLEALAERVQRP
jgi:transposase InsO family protein